MLIYDSKKPPQCDHCKPKHPQWNVGRIMASCAYCENAIPLEKVA